MDSSENHDENAEISQNLPTNGGVGERVSDNMYSNGLEGYLEFDASVTKTLIIRIATSFISQKQAEINLNREVPASKSFQDIYKESKQAWNDVLGVVEVSNAPITDDKTKKIAIDIDPDSDRPANINSQQDVTTFYSSLYRASLFPRNLFEYDETNSAVHYSPYDAAGRVFPGELVSDSGFWDAYRTVYPLNSLIHPQQYSRSIRGWLNAYKEGGWLPSWASPGERGAMTGNMQDCTIADAIVKNADGVNMSLAYESIRKDVFTVVPAGSTGGRKGMADYLSKGYLPVDGIADNAVSATLNYALADYSVAMAAKKLGFTEDYEKLINRSVNWRKVWDPNARGGIPAADTAGFFRGKLANGSFLEHFDA